MQINIKLNDELRDFITAFPERVETASFRAVNRATDGIKTDVSKIVTSKYNVKKKDVNVGISKVKANRSNLRAEVGIGGKQVPLYKFKPKPSKYNSFKRPKEGISVELRKGKKTLYRSSFFLPNGNIFIRKGKERLPIKKLVGPRIDQMLDNASRLEVKQGIERRLLTNFKQQLRLGAQF